MGGGESLPSNYIEIETGRRNLILRLGNMVSELFEDDRIPIFIPAGRSLLSTLSEQLQNINIYHIDYLMRAFLERINNLKPNFKNNLDAIIDDKKQLTASKIDFERVSVAKKIAKNILKGEYQADSGGEKIFF